MREQLEAETTKAALSNAQKQLEVQLLQAARETVAAGGKALPSDAIAGKAAVLPAAVGGPDTLGFFHNTCLLVKVLMANRSGGGGASALNLPIDTLYETVLRQKTPIEEWPQFIYQKYSAAAAGG